MDFDYDSNDMDCDDDFEADWEIDSDEDGDRDLDEDVEFEVEADESTELISDDDQEDVDVHVENDISGEIEPCWSIQNMWDGSYEIGFYREIDEYDDENQIKIETEDNEDKGDDEDDEHLSVRPADDEFNPELRKVMDRLKADAKSNRYGGGYNSSDDYEDEDEDEDPIKRFLRFFGFGGSR